MIKKIAVSAIVCTTLFAGVYLVPQEYDNVVSSTRSFSYGIISQSTSDISGNSYTIGGVSTNYRCLKIPKINCIASVAEINSNISEYSLKNPTTEALMDTFQIDLRVEDDVLNWYLCGAGYGGQVWDSSTMTSTDVAGVTQVDHSYTPNSQIEEYYYFTGIANSSVRSYMSVTYNQTCN